MKLYITSLVLVFLLVNSTHTLQAEDLLPSEVYYNENIAVNNIGASAPTLGSGEGDDGSLNPGGDGWGGGGWVGSPVGEPYYLSLSLQLCTRPFYCIEGARLSIRIIK